MTRRRSARLGSVRADRIDAVAIGASAGGVEALSVLLPALPAALRAACSIVLHLPRERPSLLAEIFAPKCARAGARGGGQGAGGAGHGLFRAAGLSPARRRRRTAQLALSVDELVNFSRPSIDVLFESAADVYGPRLLGIILTGANHDGAAGLAAVHEAGGHHRRAGSGHRAVAR